MIINLDDRVLTDLGPAALHLFLNIVKCANNGKSIEEEVDPDATKELHEKNYITIRNGIFKIRTSRVTVNSSIRSKAVKIEEAPEIIEEEEDYGWTFEDFWKVYPNKKGKEDASKLFYTRIKELGAEKLKQALRNFKRDMIGKEKRFIVHGDRFLRNRYADYLEEQPDNTSDTQKVRTNNFQAQWN